MTNSDDHKESPHYQLGRHAYQTGVIHAKLMQIKDCLTMGNEKEALLKVGEALKYMSEKMVIEFYEEEGKTDGSA